MPAILRRFLILHFTIFIFHFALPLQAAKVACWQADGKLRVAAVDGDVLHLGWLDEAVVQDDGAPVSAKDISLLAGGVWEGKPALLAARGAELLRLDAQRQWAVLGTAPAPIRQILPALDASPAALLLTGEPGEPVLKDDAVYWATWEKAFAIAPVAEIKSEYHPWQLYWTRTAGESRVAAAVYKSTPYVKFEHNCMFVYAWQPGIAEARWLGSRLSRPYVEAAHADLRGDGNWRMAAVEVTRDGRHGISLYRPKGFGYEGEWRTEAIAGLQHIAAYGDTVLLFGADKSGKPLAWQLCVQGDAYRLEKMTTTPPSPEALARADATRLAGWWEGRWHMLTIANKTLE